jgi:hypothetical protein
MAQPTERATADAVKAAAKSVNDAFDWASVAPKFIAKEDAMDPYKVKVVWANMFSAAGLKAPTEKQQMAFKLAVYVYGKKNGTSREGQYSGLVQLADGFEFNAAVIPQCTGKMEIRRFFRGNMMESYDALKNSRVIENDPVEVAKAAKMGISASAAFATADWLTDCPKFTPLEAQAHEASFSYSISRARRARDGSSLEGVEKNRMMEGLASQGHFEGPPSSGRVDF